MHFLRSFFCTLRSLLRLGGEVPVIAPDANFGITEEDIASLRTLRESKGFESLVKLLDAQVKIYAEQLLSPSSRDAATLHELRGVLIGLRKAAFLVDETLAHANARVTPEQRAAAAEHARVSRERASTYATPAWK